MKQLFAIYNKVLNCQSNWAEIQVKLCVSAVSVSALVLSQPQAAIKYLEDGLQSAQLSGDLYLSRFELQLT